MIRKSLLLFFLISIMSPLFAEDVMTEGHTPGFPTMDMEAATEYARTAGLPLFLNFTGSDWCQWCQLMQKNVFTKKVWSDWMTNNLVFVTLDFPQNQDIVPEKYRQRNAELAMAYGVEGYPTYIILDSDGETELGRLGAGQTKTAEIFIEEIKGITRFSSSSLDRFSSKLQGTSLTEYNRLVNEVDSLRDYIAEWNRRNAPEQLDGNLEEIRAIQTEYALSVMNRRDKRSYNEHKEQADAVMSEMNAWFQTNPPNTQENQLKYGEFVSQGAEHQLEMEKLVLKYLE